jgi:hypothetical protein
MPVKAYCGIALPLQPRRICSLFYNDTTEMLGPTIKTTELCHGLSINGTPDHFTRRLHPGQHFLRQYVLLLSYDPRHKREEYVRH